jgi:hypothetical protein
MQPPQGDWGPAIFLGLCGRMLEFAENIDIGFWIQPTVEITYYD